MQENSGRPLPITLIFLFYLFIFTPLFILGLFNPKVTTIAQLMYGKFFIPGIILGVISLVSVFGIFLMKKWGFYLYTVTATIGIVLDLLVGKDFKPIGLAGPSIIILLGILYYKRLS